MVKFTYDWPMFSGTATVVLFNKDRVLLGLRSRTAEVHPGKWCLPGGFGEAKIPHVRNGERIRETALREVMEETNIAILDEDELNLFWDSTDPGTDPREHVINLCYWVEVPDDLARMAEAGDDLDDVLWFEIASLKDQLRGITNIADPCLAFDHDDILRRALKARGHAS